MLGIEHDRLLRTPSFFRVSINVWAACSSGSSVKARVQRACPFLIEVPGRTYGRSRSSSKPSIRPSAGAGDRNTRTQPSTYLYLPCEALFDWEKMSGA